MSVTNRVVNQPPSPVYLNRREFLAYMLIGFALLSAGLLVTIVVHFSIPPANTFQHNVGNISNYLPSQSPYPIHINQDRLWLVNTGANITVFSGKTPHQTNHPIEWVPVTQRFEDPLTGSKFTLNGQMIKGPVIRNMDKYEVSLKNGRIVVDTSKIIFGDKACYQISSKQQCDWLYKNQTQFVK